MNKLNLHILGRIIEINFLNTKYYLEQDLLKSEIVSHFKGYLNYSKPEKVDYIIDFANLKNLGKRIVVNDSHFILLFKKINKNHFKAHYFINLGLFIRILNQILLDILLQNNAFMMHGSAINYKGQALIFFGPSGAGKSTIVRLLRKKYSTLSNDVMIFKIDKLSKKFQFYQMPYGETPRWIFLRSDYLPIGAMFFINKSNKCGIKKLMDKKMVLKLFMSQYLSDKKVLRKQIPLISKFIYDYNNFFYLFFNKNTKQLSEVINGLNL